MNSLFVFSIMTTIWIKFVQLPRRNTGTDEYRLGCGVIVFLELHMFCHHSSFLLYTRFKDIWPLSCQGRMPQPTRLTKVKILNVYPSCGSDLLQNLKGFFLGLSATLPPRFMKIWLIVFFFSVILLTNKQTKPKTKPPLAEVTNIETLSIF